MSTLQQKTQVHSKHLVSHAAIFFTALSNVTVFLGRTAWPILDLVFRLWIGNKILIAGVLKLHNWTTSVFLATHEYPVLWLNPKWETFLGVFAQLIGGSCLILGFFTRVGALSVLILSLMIQSYYVTLDVNLLLIVLMAGYILRGAGPLSLDQLFEHGISRSPLPFAMTLHNFFKATQNTSNTIYLLGVRLWLLITWGYLFWVPSDGLQSSAVWIPVHSLSLLIAPQLFVLPLFLALGFATRFVAFLLLVVFGVSQIHTSELAYGAYWMMIMAILFVSGPGFCSLDQVILSFFKKRYPQLSGKPAFTLDNLPHVVIIGGGFGGIACATALAHVPVRVTLIDKNNYHLFQPLLYQVATGNLSSGDIATPIRSIFLDQFNAQVLLGTVTAIDKEQRQVITDQFQLSYDYLIIATGATHSYFGKETWEPFAPGLKSIEDAISVRSRMMQAFERAEFAQTEVERQNLLNFVIVGGGPTGVELAGAIVELARYGMEKDFRHFDPSNAQVILVQAAPRLLPAFSEKSSAQVQRSLEAIGVKVYTNSAVELIDELGVIVQGQRIYSKSVFWAAGVKASAASLWLNASADPMGRVLVNDDFSVPDCDSIYVIGDTAAANLWQGKPMPGLAPAAKQSGKYIAKIISARVLNKPHPKPFNYTHLGSLATISRKTSIVELNRWRLHGELAWWFWGVIHVSFLVGTRNKFSVLSNWIWSFFTFRPNNLLITSVKVKQATPDPQK